MTKSLPLTSIISANSRLRQARAIVVAISLSCCLLVQSVFAAWRPGEMKVRVDNATPQVISQLLRIGIEVEHSFENTIFLYLIPDELKQLGEYGIHPEILIPDMAAYSSQLLEQPELKGYPDHQDLTAILDSMASAYPQLFLKVSYGKSAEGKELWAVKISDNAAVDEPEPEIGFDAAHHGDEILTTQIIIQLMTELLDRYDSVERIRKLVDNSEIWFFPMANPDGRELLTRRNSNFVDINRDWGYMWDGWGNSKKPYSQPETRAMFRWLLDHQFVMMTSVHAGAQLISYPWSYRPGGTPDQQLTAFLASGYARTSGYKELPFGEGFNRLYPISGSAKDSYYGIRGAISWTLEVAEEKLVHFGDVEHYYRQNRKSLLQLIEMSQQGIHGTVTAIGSGEPVATQIYVSNSANDFWPVYSDPNLGDFHKFLPAGTYSLRIEANGYKTQFLKSVKVDSTGSDIAVQMTRLPGVNAFQVVACQVPDNNFANHGLTYQVLGPPDEKGYSLGRSGWIMLDLGERVFDLPGDDLRIVGAGHGSEGYLVEVADSWSGPWRSLGKGQGTTKFDLADEKIKHCRYLRIEDDGDGFTGITNAGFDLDAVEALLIPENSAYLIASGHSIIDTMTNYNAILEAGEIVGVDLLIENLGDLATTDVLVTISSANRYIKVLADSATVSMVGEGKSSVAAGFRIEALPSAPHQTTVPLEVRIAAAEHEWLHLINLEIFGGASIRTKSSEMIFGDVFLDFSAELPLVIENSGMDTLKLFQCRTGSEFFGVENQQLLIPPGESAELSVWFKPRAADLHSDTLVILNNDPQQTLYTMPLAGVGASLPALALSEDSISVSMGIDDSLQISLEISNAGAGQLDYQLGLYEALPERLNAAGFAYPMAAIQHLTLPEEAAPAAASRDRQRLYFDAEQLSSEVELPFSFPFLNSDYQTLLVGRDGALILRQLKYETGAALDAPLPYPQITPLMADFEEGQETEIFYARKDEQITIRWEKLTRPGYDGYYDTEVRLSASGLIEFLYHDVAEIDSGFFAGLVDGSGQELLNLRSEVQPRQHLSLPQSGWFAVGPDSGELTSNHGDNIEIEFRTRGLLPGIYHFDLVVISNDPLKELHYMPIRLAVEESVGISTATDQIPESAMLFQNYPNPFNPVTTIAFHIPEQAQTRLIVYNTLGQAVRSLVDESLSPGKYQVTWDGQNDFGQQLPTGIYFYELQTRDFSQIRKMILLH